MFDFSLWSNDFHPFVFGRVVEIRTGYTRKYCDGYVSIDELDMVKSTYENFNNRKFSNSSLFFISRKEIRE